MRHVLWKVRSQSDPDDSHNVVWFLDEDRWECECAGYAWRGACRHIRLVEEWTLAGLLNMEVCDESLGSVPQVVREVVGGRG